MLISWRYKFLFVHVPKTGGTSLSRALTPFARPADRITRSALATPVLRRLIMTVWPGRDPVGRLTGVDTHANLATIEEKFGPERIAPLRIVTFARNPYTQAYSMYQHMRRTETHPLHAEMQSKSFQEMLRDYYLKGWGVQRRYLRKKGTDFLKVDFIGRFEALEEDAAVLAEFLRLPRPLRLSHLNAAPRTQDDIAEAFGDMSLPFAEAMAEEFDLFGYSTDIARAHEPPSRAPADPISDDAKWVC